MEEIWKDIEGYEGIYEISNIGRIKNKNGLIMKQKPSKDGYVPKTLQNKSDVRLDVTFLFS